MSGEDTVLFRDGRIEQDRWTTAGRDDALPEDGAIIVPLATWFELRTRNTLEQWDIGVSVAAGEDVSEIESDLDRISLVSLDFPKFTDGRSYSAARLLRERYGFEGEIRATGDVLLDQIPLMLRCGFDAFAISHGPTKRALEAGRLPEVPIFLQPAGERGEVPLGTRPWLRRRAQTETR